MNTIETIAAEAAANVVAPGLPDAERHNRKTISHAIRTALERQDVYETALTQAIEKYKEHHATKRK